MTIVIKAVIYMPEEERQNAALINQCFGRIARRGYIFDSIVSDWNQLWSMIEKHEIQVVVYARPEHINPDWTPRFELAEQEGKATPAAEPTQETPTRGSRRSRRPNRLR